MENKLKITSNLDQRNIARFIKYRLNPMLNSLFEANGGVKTRSKNEQFSGRVL